MHNNDANLFWEVGKAVLHGRIMTFMAKYKKSILKNKRLRSAQSQLMHDNFPMHWKIWRQAKHKFDLWVDTQKRIHQSHLELKYHKFGNKPGEIAFQAVQWRAYPHTHICHQRRPRYPCLGCKSGQRNLKVILSQNVRWGPNRLVHSSGLSRSSHPPSDRCLNSITA